MNTSGKSSERGLILIPVFVIVVALLLIVGPDLPRTLYSLDRFIRDVLVAILNFVRSFF
jgi:hypothetical protein